VTGVNTHTMMAIAAERIADLHRDAAPRPEATAKDKRRRRPRRSAKRLETAPAVRADQR
jgi:hypothetical protein